MKRFCITCLIAVVAMPFWAQAPNRFPYYIEDTIPSLMGDEIALGDSNEVESEILVPDTLPFAHPMPVFAKDTVLKAPSRQMAAQASACPTDSVVGRDVNGNYVSLKTYRYDDAGRTIETAEWKWVNGVKTGVTKLETEFYDNGKTKADASWTWDNTKKDWRGSTRNEYTYDDAGRTTLWDILQWNNDTWDWMGKTRYIYSYAFPNDANKYAWSEQYNYDTTAIDWVGYTRSDYEYNASNRNTLAVTSNWSTASNAWVPQKKYIYEYDGTTANKTLDLYYSVYDASTDTWGGSGSTKKIATYFNSTTKKLLDEQYTWDTTKKTWKGSSKTEYDYIVSGNKKTLTLKYKWASNLWDWVYNTVDSTKYDASNREIDKASYKWTNGAWSGSSRTTTSYTSAGQTDRQIAWKWTSEGWVKNTKTGYVYDGTLTTEEYSASWNGTEWIKTASTVYSYNADDLKDTVLTYQLVGAELVLSQRTYYIYDGKGNNIFTHNATRKDNAWKFSSATRLDVEYNDAGLQTLSVTWYCSSDSIWHGDQKEVHQYTASGKSTFIGKYKCESDIWNPSYEVTYEYDEQERTLSNQRFDWSNGVKKGTSRSEYAYRGNDKDPYITANYFGWDATNNCWIGISKTEKLYNDAGKQYGSISYTWSNNAWEGMFRYTYQYDSSNREIEQIVERYTNSDWVNDERYEKEYQGNKQSKNNVYYWNGTKWVYRSRNEKTYDEDAAAKLRTELVASYSSGNLTSYDFKRYHYACDPHAFLIRFLNWDGSLISEQNFDAGVTPSCDSIPVRPANDSTSYTFKAWSPAISPVTEATTYTADYDSVTLAFPITFVNYDGSELQSEILAYGKIPTYEGPKPSKPANDSMTYTFKSWSPAIVRITQAATYTATFDSVRNQYTITFKDADGTTLESKKWDYGATPTCTEPSKQPDAQYTYTFGGWDKTVVAVVADAEYTATYATTTNQYTVTFKDADGTTLESKKWDYGATPTCTEPTKPADAQYSYSFKAWTPSVSDVTAEATYTAIYDTTAILYTVTFANYDGKVLQSQDYQYGATPKYTGTTPSRASNKEYAYTFKAWKPKIVPVTQNAVYTATYDSTEIESYVTILFLNYDSTLIYSQVVRYKRMPVYEGPTPTRKPSAHYTYTFKSWSPAISVALENTIYIAQYDSLTRYYSIRFVDYDGTILQSDELLYGETPFYRGAEPTREEDSEYTYTFDGWTPKIAPVDEDVAYVATYKAEPRNTADRHPYADGPDESKPMYNILGNPVDSHYRGIVIQGGRKFLR